MPNYESTLSVTISLYQSLSVGIKIRELLFIIE
nr:MAG TPA: hypothetical protein [Caudoviricetes sp.]